MFILLVSSFEPPIYCMSFTYVLKLNLGSNFEDRKWTDFRGSKKQGPSKRIKYFVSYSLFIRSLLDYQSPTAEDLWHEESTE